MAHDPFNRDTPAKHGLPKMLRYGKRYGLIPQRMTLIDFAMALQRIFDDYADTERETLIDED